MDLTHGMDVRRGLRLGELGCILDMGHYVSYYFINSQMIKRDDIVWLSGLLEGEGCFYLNTNGSPIISVNMTDEDIIVRIAALWNMRVYHRKNIWRASICGVSAIGWMMTLHPLLGIRRKEKVISVIKHWRKINYRAAPGMYTMAKCHPDRMVHALGLCSMCYQRRQREKQLLKLTG